MASNPSYAQCMRHHGADMGELVASATTVVEAKVLNSSSFWGRKGAMIYTRYELEVYQVFKGEARSTFDLVAPGGVVGDDAISVSPSADLQPGQTGIFALKPAVYALPRGVTNGPAMQSVVAQGTLVNYSPVGEEAYLFTGNLASRRVVAQNLVAITGKAPRQLKELPVLDVNRVVMPQVDSIVPNIVSAGVGDVITIHGEGFGEGTGTVFFPNADQGGSGYVAAYPWHIESWTTTAISVKVPHKAGTGNPLLLTTNNGISFSPVGIEVAFAYNNVMSSGAFHRPKLIDHKSRDDGGYLFTLSDDNANNGISVAAFEPVMNALNAAAGAWQDSIGLPIYIGEDCPMVTENSSGSLDDGHNVISFDHDEWDIREQLGEQVLAATISRYAKCGNSEWELTDVDMVIRRGSTFNDTDDVNWSFDGTPGLNELDFQSVILHELGHALQLQHIVNEDGVMHYAASFGATKHELGFEDDMAGGLYAMMEGRSYSPPAIPCFPLEHFDRSRKLGKFNPGFSCIPVDEDSQIQGLQTPASGSAGVDGEVRAYPNPKPKDTPLQLSVYMEASGNVSLFLFNGNGQLVTQRQTQLAQGRHTLEWPLPDVPSGFYQLMVQNGLDRTPLKIVIP